MSGVRLDTVDPTELAQTTALVFQETFLFADTIRENVTLGTDVPDEDVWVKSTSLEPGLVQRFPAGLSTR